MLIYRGAEAEIHREKFLGMEAARKTRKRKAYKHPLLDEKLRGERLRNEAKMLRKARAAVNTPHVLAVVGGDTLFLEFVEGNKVKDLFLAGKTDCAPAIGKAVRALHDEGIVHNDLTTSNMIVSGKKLFFIDFGLSRASNALEDQAVDLVVFRRMLSSTHYDVCEAAWREVAEAYGVGEKMAKKMAAIESRAKYK